MAQNNPNHAWVAGWAVLQLCCVMVAMTFVETTGDVLSLKQTLYTAIAFIGIHCFGSYAMLATANVATDSPWRVSAMSTFGIVAIAVFPTEPRIAQTLAATVFVGVVLWQSLLKLHEE